MNNVFKVVTISIATIITLSAVTPASAAEPVAELSPSSMVQEGATSVQLRTVTDGTVVDTAVGSRDQRGTPIQNQSHTRAASITKTMVATVILQLRDEGKIDLDKTIDNYVGKDVVGSDKITVRQLLNHTSGLQEYLASIPHYDINSYPTTDTKYKLMKLQGYNTRDLLRFINSRPLAHEPGSKFAYANANYVVAGEIINRVTGKSYGKNIQERIFNKLGMKNSIMPGQSIWLPEPAVHGYQDISHPEIGGTGFVDMAIQNPSQVNASGELISTTGDLATFMKGLVSGKLISQASLKEMTTASPQSPVYGLGIFTRQTPCGITYSHGGNLYGYATEMYTKADGSKQVAVASAEGKMPYFTVAEKTSQLAIQEICK